MTSQPTRLFIDVHFQDKSFSTMLIHLTTTTKEFITCIKERLGLISYQTDISDFRIFLVKEDEERCLEDDELVWKAYLSEVVSPETDLDKFTEKIEWLRIRKEIKKDAKLVFKMNPLIKIEKITIKDELLYLTFTNSHSYILDEVCPVSESLALELASLQMQIHYSDYNRNVHIPGFLKVVIDHFVPKSILNENKFEDLESLIFQSYMKLNGMKKNQAMLEYISKVNKLKFYGSRSWNVESMNFNNKNIPNKLILCVSSTGIHLLKMGSKEIIEDHIFKDIQCWGYQKDFFGFISCSPTKEKYQFRSLNGKEIVKTLNSCVDMLLKENEK